MTPAAARAMLDRQLAAHGRTVVLRRYTGPESAPLSTWADSDIRARALPYPSVGAAGVRPELTAGVTTNMTWIIASPSDVGSDPVLAARDAVLIGGTEMTILIWNPIVIGDEVVRIEARLG